MLASLRRSCWGGSEKALVCEESIAGRCQSTKTRKKTLSRFSAKKEWKRLSVRLFRGYRLSSVALSQGWTTAGCSKCTNKQRWGHDPWCLLKAFQSKTCWSKSRFMSEKLTPYVYCLALCAWNLQLIYSLELTKMVFPSQIAMEISWSGTRYVDDKALGSHYPVSSSPVKWLSGNQLASWREVKALVSSGSCQIRRIYQQISVPSPIHDEIVVSLHCT